MEANEQLQEFIRENAVSFSRALGAELQTDLPQDPENLIDFTQRFINENGVAAKPALEAAIGNMRPAGQTSGEFMSFQKSGDGKKFDWGGVVQIGLGIVENLFGGGNKQGSADVLAVSQQAMQNQQKTINSILIGIGLVIVAVVIFVVVKKK